MCLSWAFVKFCVCSSFPVGIEGGMWYEIVLILGHCLSIDFVIKNRVSSECYVYYYKKVVFIFKNGSLYLIEE